MEAMSTRGIFWHSSAMNMAFPNMMNTTRGASVTFDLFGTAQTHAMTFLKRMEACYTLRLLEDTFAGTRWGGKIRFVHITRIIIFPFTTPFFMTWATSQAQLCGTRPQSQSQMHFVTHTTKGPSSAEARIAMMIMEPKRPDARL